MSAPALFGWDVGGAHLKGAALDAAGRVCDVAQWACPLWLGIDELERAFDRAFERWPAAAGARHAATMTGEMVDLFDTRAHGVSVIAQTLAARLGASVRFYAGERWLGARECADGGTDAWRGVASANWRATASWAAAQAGDALLIDVGSTTTDIVPLVGGRVAARACDDAGRLASGELVYHGVVRTPLCGVAHRIGFDGAEVNVMNEWFATTADVYRVTGELWEPHDLYPAADRGAKTPAGSRARLARMIGRDAHDAPDDVWRVFAFAWRARQLRALHENVARVCAAHPALARAPVVGAGCGRFLAEALAQAEARDYADFAALAGVEGERAEWAATCAPCVAVALLAAAGDARAQEGTREGVAT